MRKLSVLATSRTRKEKKRRSVSVSAAVSVQRKEKCVTSLSGYLTYRRHKEFFELMRNVSWVSATGFSSLALCLPCGVYWRIQQCKNDDCITATNWEVGRLNGGMSSLPPTWLWYLLYVSVKNGFVLFSHEVCVGSLFSSPSYNSVLFCFLRVFVFAGGVEPSGSEEAGTLCNLGAVFFCKPWIHFNILTICRIEYIYMNWLSDQEEEEGVAAAKKGTRST